ncbi:YodC family protein [Herbaspirillum frisingense]|uniref:Uncharacterized protein YodC (DUF2158 family) n=1 Tax=Herbaspirillum frisingense TaxID=92645 RepID=A0ABU1PI04_9BURK|nr:DUF2158 domain-containing protein [Herbaspirillum frisingense]MDR6585541.1 uncharacterized protein YodC (DUF2158 family) [Herbaspirillum frisingense]
MAWNVGDTVRLKSGGPVMTVQQAGDFSMKASIRDGARCIWFKDDVPSEQIFASDALEAADKPSW